MHRRFLVAVFAAVALAAAAAPMASAVEPTRVDRVESGSEVVDWLCPFPVVNSFTTDWHEVFFYDQDGDMVRSAAHNIVQGSYSANGTTAVGERWVVNATVLYGPDGAETYIVWRVNTERYRLPDGTRVTLTGAGLMSYDYTTGEFKATPGLGHGDDAKILCDALAP